jgi:hypothetical protein
MTAIAEDVLAALPQEWRDQVVRAYGVMAAPSPFDADVTLDEAYGAVPFADLYDAVLAEGDGYGAAWLEWRALDEFSAALDGEDELGLGRWLEHLHPRGEGGVFREVRGRRLARQADRAYRSYLRDPQRRDAYDAWRSQPFADDREIMSEKAAQRDRMRERVQGMVDRGAPIKEIRERLGQGTAEERRAAEERLARAEDAHLTAMADLLDQISDRYFDEDPRQREALQEEYDWHRRRLARQIRHRRPGPPTRPAVLNAPKRRPADPVPGMVLG